MANGHGGYREPTNPAPVSGPGQLARRTDGGPAQVRSTVPDLPYGDKKQQMADQALAPMAAAAPMPSPASPGPQGQPQAPSLPTYEGGPFNAPGNGPITAGMPFGPGAGPEVLGVPLPGARPDGRLTQMLQGMMARDTTGTLAKLYTIAKQRGV